MTDLDPAAMLRECADMIDRLAAENADLRQIIHIRGIEIDTSAAMIAAWEDENAALREQIASVDHLVVLADRDARIAETLELCDRWERGNGDQMSITAVRAALDGDQPKPGAS